MKANFPLSVLLVDDDSNIRRTLAISLKDFNCAVEQASSVQEAMAKMRSKLFDFVLSDFKMEKESGLDLIKQVNAAHPGSIVAVMTAFASFENAVEMIKEGAFDYLPKPFTNVQLGHLLGKVQALVQLKRENIELRRSKFRRDYFSGYTSAASQRLEEFIRKVAPTDGTVLLSGESGTGKSELAKLIHELSGRASKSFVTVYCTTLTESLLESELFGHMKGSFTGAVQDKVGKLEHADGGTVFLDEVGELSLNGQTKLLRFLQDHVFERVGSNKEVAVDVRVLAATNKNLPEAVSAGTFREDLFYRLNVLECIVPSLRHRKEDLSILIERITRELSQGKPLPTFSKSVTEALLAHNWPGNIRELRNVLERVVMLSQGREIVLSDLPESVLKATEAPAPGAHKLLSLEEIEKEHIQHVLSHTKSLEEASQVLGITTVTLWRKRKELGLP